MSKRIYWIVENKFGVQYLHKVTNPGVSEVGFYRAATSVDAFRNRETTRWNDKIHMTRKDQRLFHWCHVYYDTEWKNRFDAERTVRKMLDAKYSINDDPYTDPELHLPYVEHDGIFAFYEYVGYDRKRKRFA